MKRNFRFYAKIKNCNTVFHKELPPGCVGMQDISFTSKSNDPDHIWLWKIISEKTNEVMDEYFYVEIEEVS